MIYKGHHLATVEPLNDNVRKWVLLNYDKAQDSNGWFTFSMDYLEDIVSKFQEENFSVEVR